MQAEKAQIKNIPDNPKPNPGDYSREQMKTRQEETTTV
jgi:hypothetical protein